MGVGERSRHGSRRRGRRDDYGCSVDPTDSRYAHDALGVAHLGPAVELVEAATADGGCSRDRGSDHCEQHVLAADYVAAALGQPVAALCEEVRKAGARLGNRWLRFSGKVVAAGGEHGVEELARSAGTQIC